MSALFSLDNGWKLIINDLGLTPQQVLKAAGLPVDILQRDKPMVTAKQYFDMWRAIEGLINQPDVHLLIATSITVESFSPPLFAALCSDNLATALDRLQKYKKLIGPLQLQIEKQKDKSIFSFESTTTDVLPDSYQMVECAFITNLLRIATRTQATPLFIETPLFADISEATKRYFNCDIKSANKTRIAFSSSVLQTEFLSKNSQMWEFFEPQLNSNLMQYESNQTINEQVTTLLLNLIPAGKANIEEMASNLCMSKRTLQRRLSSSGHAFQSLLNSVREQLAIHYLKKSNYPNAEIAFLLGFDDPNSFIRAFSSWVGESPESYRQSRKG